MNSTAQENGPVTHFKTIGIIGSGTMGVGIAQATLQAGYTVRLYDLTDTLLDNAVVLLRTQLEKAYKKALLTQERNRGRDEAYTGTEVPQPDEILHRLSCHVALTALSDCELVIEVAPEDETLKRAIFVELDTVCKPETLLASNTSSLSITAMAGATRRPEQVAGLHFFNPVSSMRLVELIRGQRTSESTLEALRAFAESLDKEPIEALDTPGFIVNRVARPFYGEALKILGEHGGRLEMVKAIDTVMREVGGFRMGPFELMDLIGIDVNFAVTKSIWNANFQLSRYRPHPIQQRLVQASLLGRKTGEGFYPYES